MPTPRPCRPAYPPPGGAPEESDESLRALLRVGPDGNEKAHAVALLLARHWRPVHEYAVICLASSASLASMVTTAAFHHVLDRTGLDVQRTALRPDLLVNVQDTVLQWAAEERISDVLPELQKTAGGRGMRATKSMAAENRKLARRSFRALPVQAQSLLWHTEVEAEPIAVSAGLLGMDIDATSGALEQARQSLRKGCVRAHWELAPTNDCRFYNRLLDIPIRKGSALLPDVRHHLDECGYCRAAAQQLGHFPDRLGALLAEAMLGWGAHRYLDSRPARTQNTRRDRLSLRHSRTRGHGTQRLRRLPRLPVLGPGIAGGGRPSSAFLMGAGLASAGLLATLLSTGLDQGGADTAVSSPADTARPPTALLRTRLQNAAADLCLGIQGRPKAGAPAGLTTCSGHSTQQWSYDTDGLLRSAADLSLCLDSQADAGIVVLGTCADQDDERGADVRYDLTVRGELLPRWDHRLALAPTSDGPAADIVVKARDNSAEQHWLTDAESTRGGASTP